MRTKLDYVIISVLWLVSSRVLMRSVFVEFHFSGRLYCDRHDDGPLWWLLYIEVSEAFTSLLYHKCKRADLFTSSPTSLIVHTSIKWSQEIHSDWQVLFHGVLIIDDARVKYGLPRRGLVIDGQGSSGQWEGLG